MEKNSSNFYFLFKKKDFTLSRGLLYISLIAATPEEATRGTWGRENVVDNPKSSVFSFKKIKIEGTTFFYPGAISFRRLDARYTPTK